jgi:hypothetical protein
VLEFAKADLRDALFDRLQQHESNHRDSGKESGNSDPAIGADK